jgi:hypothetical protein
VPTADFTRAASKLSALLLVIASLFVMSALGMVILITVAEVSHLIFVTNSQGMNR